MSERSVVCPRCSGDYYKTKDTKSRRFKTITICPTCCDEEAMIDWYRSKCRESDTPGEAMERDGKFANKIMKGN